VERKFHGFFSEVQEAEADNEPIISPGGSLGIAVSLRSYSRFNRFDLNRTRYVEPLRGIRVFLYFFSTIPDALRANLL
jgi:hypothetical protein